MELTALPELLGQLETRTAAELEREDLLFAPCPERAEEGAETIARLVVELANLEGGVIVVGVTPDVRGKAAVTGCPIIVPDSLRRAVYALTEPPILVGVQPVTVADRTLLVVTVPKGLPPHVVRSDAERKAGARVPEWDFSAQETEEGESAIDPLEVERLRNTLQAREPGSSLNRLEPRALLQALGLLSPEQRLTIAGLLLVGREPVLRKHLPGHEAVFLHHTRETEYDRRLDTHKPLLALLEEMTQQVEPHNRLFTLKVGLFHFELPDYPTEVFREALLNAFVHRDYASLNPVYVRLHPDRLEIANPGGFIGGITPENIMSHEPVTRNRRLAEVLQRLRLVERSGMGVRRMYTILLCAGKEPPVYAATPDDVRVILRSGKTDEHFARFVAQRQQKGEEFALNELIVLTYLKRNQELDLQETTRILQRGSYEAHEVLGAMVERGLLEPFGQKKGRVYRLSRAVYVELRRSVEYYLHRDAEAAYAEAAIAGYIRTNGFVTNQMVRTLLRVNKSQSSYILRKLVSAGKLVLRGRGTKAEYVLPNPANTKS
jgi:ATP-dependent DNA helicase RecG